MTFTLRYLKTVDAAQAMHPNSWILISEDKSINHMPFACGWHSLAYLKDKNSSFVLKFVAVDKTPTRAIGKEGCGCRSIVATNPEPPPPGDSTGPMAAVWPL